MHGGYATDAYEHLFSEAQKLGKKLTSDVEVTPDAARIYESLQRRGYTVERSPLAVVDPDGNVFRYLGRRFEYLPSDRNCFTLESFVQ